MLRTLLLVLCVALCGCTRVEPPRPTRPRVAVLSPAAAATMKDLGLDGLIVARHGWDIALDRSLPVVGDQSGIDYEKLLGCAPTHVVIQWGKRDLPGRLTDLAKDRGWTIVKHDPLSLTEVRNGAEELWQLFRQDRATRGAASPSPLRAEFGRALSARPGLEKAGRVLMLASLDPPAALGPGSFHHEVLVSIGGTPALETGAPYVKLDAEDVLRLNPDVIVVVLPGVGAMPNLGRIGMLDISAVRRGRVALINDPLSLTPSSAMIRFADTLAGVLDAWK